MVSTYSTYLRFAVPFVSLSIFFVPLYIEPMIRSIREKLFNRGTLHVSQSLTDAIEFLTTGIFLFPLAFILTSFVAALPFDALILWTMKRSYEEIAAIKRDKKFNFLSNTSYFIIGFNNIAGLAFSIFGIYYLIQNKGSLSYAEDILWNMVFSWFAMQGFQDLSLASFHLYLDEFV